MRWFLTLMLVVLVVCGGAFLFFHDWASRNLGLQSPIAPEPSASEKALRTINPADLISIHLRMHDQAELHLQRDPAGVWQQAGSLDLRSKEVQELVEVLTTLESRFHPIPLEPGHAGLAKFGLSPEQHPIEIKLETRTAKLTLLCGAVPEVGRSLSACPAYIRVGDQAEVLRVSSDVYATVSRPTEIYLKQRLFGTELFARVAEDRTGAIVALVPNSIKSIKVISPEGSYTLDRIRPAPPERRPSSNTTSTGIFQNELAECWKLSTPVNDRLDPAKIRDILTAIPDLWSDYFTRKDGRSPDTLRACGLETPSTEITLVPTQGDPLRLLIGNVSRTLTRQGPAAPPMGPFPPMPRMITEEYRYAKFSKHHLIFEMRADKLAALKQPPDDLRDKTIARFSTPEVTACTITRPGQTAIQLTKKKGNKAAQREDDKVDRWYVNGSPADSSQVTEVLDALSKLEARSTAPMPSPMTPPPPMEEKAILDHADAAKLKELGLDAASATKITIAAQYEVDPSDPTPDTRSYTFLLGKPDPAKKKLPVQLEGWPRVNLVDEAAFKFTDRTALAYRSRRPIDSADLELQTIAVKSGDKQYTLKLNSTETKGPSWSLSEPVVCPTESAITSRLSEDLARLQVVEFTDDAPKADDLDQKYGLAKPRATVELGFVGAQPKREILEIGADVPGKTTEVYARLNRSGSVFAITKSTIEPLLKGAEGLVSLELWQTQPNLLEEIEIARPDTPGWKLTRVQDQWQLSGAVAAAAATPELQPVLTAVASLKAESFKTLAATPKDLMEYGLDKPLWQIRLVYKETKPDGGAAASDARRTRKLIIGGPSAPGSTSHYARLEGESVLPNAVFLLPISTVKPLEVKAIDLIDRNLLRVNSELVTRIEVKGGPDASYSLLKQDKGWTMEGSTFPLNAELVDDLVFGAANLPVLRLADYGAAVKWEAYGLKDPSATITLTLGKDQPESRVIFVGNELNTGERYVRVGPDGPAVGVISGAGAAPLLRKRLAYVDPALLSFRPDQLKGLARTAGAAELEFSRSDAGWEVVKPAAFKLDQTAMDELTEQLARLRASRVVAYAAKDLKPYGLDAPAARIALKIAKEKDETVALLIGKPVDDANPRGERYAKLDTAADTAIGVLSAALSNKLLGEPLKFKDRSLGGFRGEPDKIIIERGDRKVTFIAEAGKWKMTEPVASEAEDGDLQALVSAAAKLRAEELIQEKPTDLKPYGLDMPIARLRFLIGANEALTLLVGAAEKDSPRVHVKLDKGDLVGLLDTANSRLVLSEFRKRSVWTMPGDASQVQTFTISTEAGSAVLRNVQGVWVDAARAEDKYDAAKISDTLAALVGLKAERYAVDKDANLKLYGLDKPSRVLVVSQPGGTALTLQLGGPVGGTGGKQVYARVGDASRTDVFILSEEATRLLNRNREEYLQKK